MLHHWCHIFIGRKLHGRCAVDRCWVAGSEVGDCRVLLEVHSVGSAIHLLLLREFKGFRQRIVIRQLWYVVHARTKCLIRGYLDFLQPPIGFQPLDRRPVASSLSSSALPFLASRFPTSLTRAEVGSPQMSGSIVIHVVPLLLLTLLANAEWFRWPPLSSCRRLGTDPDLATFGVSSIPVSSKFVLATEAARELLAHVAVEFGMLRSDI